MYIYVYIYAYVYIHIYVCLFIYVYEYVLDEYDELTAAVTITVLATAAIEVRIIDRFTVRMHRNNIVQLLYV
jgi:uncharacterized protein involved in tellurium resistance